MKWTYEQAADEIERLRELLRAARGILQYHRATYPDEIDWEFDNQQTAPPEKDWAGAAGKAADKIPDALREALKDKDR